MKVPWFKKKTRRTPRVPEQGDEYTFRRSRTITGTTSPHIKTSSQEKSADLKTHRLKLHELRHLRRKLLLRLVVVAVLGVGCFFLITHALSFSEKVSFRESPTQTESDAGKAYLTSIRQYLRGHPFEQFDFSLNTQALSNYVARLNSEVAEVSLNTRRDGFIVTLRRPLLVWKTDKKVFYIDETGTSFTKNVFAEPPLKVVDNSGIPTSAIGAVASSQFIHFLGQLVGAVNHYGIGQITEVIIPPNTIKEIDLKLQGKSYIIKTNVDRDPLQTGEDLYHTVRYLESKGTTPNYIDNRVTGRAFYR